ncbi:hypothetical protein BJ944DRAFT_160658 [Cunninghamella echinulata]|nr:hypothetical protein BJ944DRAFT_160658 [Cunninghamella echinulata]
MKFLGLTLLTVISSTFCYAQTVCNPDTTQLYHPEVADYTDILQELIDKANAANQTKLMLKPGRFGLREQNPIVLKPGVSLIGSDDAPTIFTVLKNDKNEVATIQVPAACESWGITDIVLDNVNIDIQPHHNTKISTISRNVFLNGGRGSIMSNFGTGLLVEHNVFLRDEVHASFEARPKYNTTNSGILFQTQTESKISNNIFGMDLRRIDDVAPHVSPDLQEPLNKIKYLKQCLNEPLADQQGYMASGIQLYNSNDIVINENILNGTFPDTKKYSQDHGISVVGSNQTYVHQNFIAGWQIGDFGGSIRFTSAVDGYVINNYMANSAIMMYAANHADFDQVENIVVSNNFLYKFLGNEYGPPEPLNGWLFEGITYYDFGAAKLNWTIDKPIWNSSVPISRFAHKIVVTNNKFAATNDLDPNVINLGNIDPTEAFVDPNNCYVTNPLVPGQTTVPLLWRQQYQENTNTHLGGKIPQRFDFYSKDSLEDSIPPSLRDLEFPEFWRAFVLKNNTVPMMDPNSNCFGSQGI